MVLELECLNGVLHSDSDSDSDSGAGLHSPKTEFSQDF